MNTILPRVYQVVGCQEGDTLPGFSSIGGYTIIYLTRKGQTLCSKCATKNVDEHDPVADAGTYDEGEDLTCDDCEETIESSYGPVSVEPETVRYGEEVICPTSGEFTAT